MENLQGKVALVTGSSRGIGRAIAVALARAGADVALNYRTRAADAKDTESEISGLGRRCIAIQADVSLSSGVDRLVDAVRTELGHIDILVNNAGIARVQSIEEITEQDWDELLDGQFEIVLSGDAGGAAGHARAALGAHHQHLFGGRARRRRGGRALRRVQGRHARLDPLLCVAPRAGRDHGECDFAGADRDGDGHVQSECDARPNSHRPFRRGQTKWRMPP